MSMHRFYIPEQEWGNKIQIEGQEARHIVKVLRFKVNNEICILNGKGKIGTFIIEKISNNSVLLSLKEELFKEENTNKAIIALALSKAIRRDFFIEKAAELGCYAIWLWQGEFSQGKISQALIQSLERKLIAGIKQSGNPWLPQICDIGNINGLIEKSNNVDFKILPWEIQKGQAIISINQLGQKGTTIYTIGPEGGFSNNELDLLEKHNFIKVSLGPNILRCETAATLILGLHHWATNLKAQI